MKIEIKYLNSMRKMNLIIKNNHSKLNKEKFIEKFVKISNKLIKKNFLSQ